MREREGGPGLRCRHLLECRAAEGVSVSPALLAGERGLPLARGDVVQSWQHVERMSAPGGGATGGGKNDGFVRGRRGDFIYSQVWTLKKLGL